MRNGGFREAGFSKQSHPFAVIIPRREVEWQVKTARTAGEEVRRYGTAAKRELDGGAQEGG